MSTLNIAASELSEAITLANEGRLAEAWKILADRGDAYAYLAQYVVMPDPVAEGFAASLVAKLFRRMVRVHWDNTAGPGNLADSPLFVAVGKRHLKNYLDLLESKKMAEGLYALPTTKEIEASYRDSVTFHSLPASVAIDGIFSVIDNHLGAGQYRDWSWAEFMNFGNLAGGGPAWQPDRIVFNSDVFIGDISAVAAFTTLTRTLEDLASELNAELWLPAGFLPLLWVAKVVDAVADYGLAEYLDSRALAAGLNLLSPGLPVESFNSLLMAASNSDADAAATMLASLGRLVGLDLSSNDRSGFYLKLTALGEWLDSGPGGQALVGKLAFSPTFDPSAARTDFAALLSLTLGLPFQVSTADAAATAALGDVHGLSYEHWLQDKDSIAAGADSMSLNFSEGDLRGRACNDETFAEAGPVARRLPAARLVRRGLRACAGAAR